MLGTHRPHRSFVVGHFVVSVCLWFSVGCWSSYAEDADGEAPDVFVPDDGGEADGVDGRDVDADEGGEADGDVDGGEGGDADADVPVEVEADADTDADVPDEASTPCPEGWYDPTSGLCWQDPPDGRLTDWYDAVAICENLSLAGHPAGSWHLPTISELRSLIRGCPGTITGGACRVTDSCLGEACGSWGPCAGCSYLGGPGASGCYQEPAVDERCAGYWSSSSRSDSSSDAWFIAFHSGYVRMYGKMSHAHVRCVRRGS